MLIVGFEERLPDGSWHTYALEFDLSVDEVDSALERQSREKRDTDIRAQYYTLGAVSDMWENGNRVLLGAAPPAREALRRLPLVALNPGDYVARQGWTEEEYLRRASAWSAVHGIHPGSVVRVLAAAESYQDGWSNSWIEEMNRFVGQLCTVRGGGELAAGVQLRLRAEGIRTTLPSYGFPFYVLEVVE